MDSKILKLTNLKALSIIIAFTTIGWPQTIMAQYNLQVDSVITEVISGQATVTQSFYFVVPEGKIWKVQSAYFSGPNASTYGIINLRIRDSHGKQFSVYKTGFTSSLYNANIFSNYNSNGFDNTGVLWLNSGSQIIFSVTAATNFSSAGYYRGLLSALQFSTE